MPLIKSSAINPLPNRFATSPCIHAAAEADSFIDIFVSPTKLAIIPAKTSPDPITANSLELCLFITILPGDQIIVVFPFSKIFDLHSLKNLKTFSLFSKLFSIDGNSF